MKHAKESHKDVNSRPSLGSEYKAQKRDRCHDELLDAATAVFAAKGFHEATLKDIADYMGVLPPSLYHYIDSKEAAHFKINR